jgi:di-N-acetylchitobiase
MLPLLVVLAVGLASRLPDPPPWQPPTGFPTNPCPCGVLCQPLVRADHSPNNTARNRTLEFFGFHATSIYNGTNDDWQHWDFDSLTTIAVWSIWQLPFANWSMLCKAHAHGVRVVVPFHTTNVPADANDHSAQIMNATARQEWIQYQVALISALGLDGVNFDIEGQYNVSHRSSVTALVCETQQALRAVLPSASVTFDLDITPDNPTITGGYDYLALSHCLDHIVPMAYDMTGGSVAANAPLPVIIDGVVRQYKALGIPPARLVVALPWYAYDFTCATRAVSTHALTAPTAPAPMHTCALPPSTHPHANWNSVHTQLGYGQVLDLHAATGSPQITFNSTTVTKWFDYVNVTTQQRHRVCFDDPETLLVKYTALLKLGVAGVGAWTVDAVHRAAPADTAVAAKTMWAAVASALR